MIYKRRCEETAGNMQNLFFLGIILVGKEKIPNKSTKTIQKQKKKKIKASHFAVETVGRSMDRDSDWGGAGGISRLLAGGCRKSPKRKSLLSKRKGVRVFSAVRTQKNKNKHMRSPQAPQTGSAKCAQEPQRFQ